MKLLDDAIECSFYTYFMQAIKSLKIDKQPLFNIITRLRRVALGHGLDRKHNYTDSLLDKAYPYTWKLCDDFLFKNFEKMSSAQLPTAHYNQEMDQEDDDESLWDRILGLLFPCSAF